MGWYNGTDGDCSCCDTGTGTLANCTCCDILWDTREYTGSWIADFGAGGWSDEDYVDCDQVAGEITLDSIGNQYGCVAWRYYLTEMADFECVCTGTGTDTIDGARIKIELAIDHSSPTCVDPEFPVYTWRYILTVEGSIDTNCGELGATESYARYYGSWEGTVSPGDCVDDVDPSHLDAEGKMTLTKDTEYHDTACDGNWQACSGSLPETVKIWREPK